MKAATVGEETFTTQSPGMHDGVEGGPVEVAVLVVGMLDDAHGQGGGHEAEEFVGGQHKFLSIIIQRRNRRPAASWQASIIPRARH